jgi:hypothetical protein
MSKLWGLMLLFWGYTVFVSVYTDSYVVSI